MICILLIFHFIIDINLEDNSILKSSVITNDKDGKIYKMLSFAGSGRDVADPWYTGDFDATYRDVVEGCEGFLKKVLD